MKPLIVPTLNLNGNQGPDLVASLTLVLHNIGHLQQSMRDASDIVHGRNFQTVAAPEYARREADDAWRQRWQLISEMETDIRNLAVRIQDQVDERASRIKRG